MPVSCIRRVPGRGEDDLLPRLLQRRQSASGRGDCVERRHVPVRRWKPGSVRSDDYRCGHLHRLGARRPRRSVGLDEHPHEQLPAWDHRRGGRVSNRALPATSAGPLLRRREPQLSLDELSDPRSRFHRSPSTAATRRGPRPRASTSPTTPAATAGACLRHRPRSPPEPTNSRRPRPPWRRRRRRHATAVSRALDLHALQRSLVVRRTPAVRSRSHAAGTCTRRWTARREL